MLYYIRKLFKPEIFQGAQKKKNYFEGWYFKLVDEAETNSIAVIPGISYGNDSGDHHAFIQVIESPDYEARYIRFDIKEFKYSRKDFNISIGGSTFNRNGIILDLQDKGYTLKGSLKFKNVVPFPSTLLKPGIMGPYSFVPFMECFHGVVNIHHCIEGELKSATREIDFSNGYGYIEKDWGASFPKWWIWVMCNHFERNNVSLMFSIANIPWLKTHFDGFISFLRIDDKLYNFATYTGAKIQLLQYGNGKINIIIADRKYILSIAGEYMEDGVLKAPDKGIMHRSIKESISSKVEVMLRDHNGEVIFKGNGKNAGMEIVTE